MTAGTATGLTTTYSFTDGARCMVGKGRIAIILPAKVRIDGLDDAQVSLLRNLDQGSASVPDDAGDSVDSLLVRLLGMGAVGLTVSVDDKPVYTVKPFRAPPTSRPAPGTVTESILSRFTVCHRIDGELVAENPRAWADVVLHDPSVLAGLTDPSADTISPSVLRDRLRADLGWAGHLTPAGVEESSFETRSWNPHELWFHRRSTVGDRGTSWAGFGPTRWADGQFEPLPACPAEYPGEPLPLPKPDLARLRTQDVPLAAVVEDRRSHRSFDDDHPITAEQLGELLFRCARVRGVRTTNTKRTVPEELPSKPFPSGGSLYELEIYPVVRTAAGLSPGMYHYDAYEHALRPVADYADPAVEKLIAPAALTLEGRLPQVLLVLAARTGRISWTYEQMPYAVILKHVGVLTQNLYLAATAMGLGGVAQGYGDTAAFAAATGRDELVECNVGTFVVGAIATGSGPS